MLSAAALLIGLFSACGGSDPSSPTGGMLAVELTDGPTELVTEIQVFIVGLTVKRSGQPTEVIADEIGLVELLSLQDTSELLAIANVEAGIYEHIRVDLDQDRSFVIELATGAEEPLKIASEEIKVLGGFEVLKGGTTTVLLDFDAEQSLRQQGNGDWLLVPVIVQANVDTR